ncbi:MAG: hypothetical protein M0Z69_13535 [Actinomycetota bacterium]|nr:hypothetical protein [Actinomycetota bacterium]
MTTIVVLAVVLLVARAAWCRIAARRSETRDVAEWLQRKGFADEPVSEVVERLGPLSVGEITAQRERYHYQRGYDAAVADEHERRSQAARRAAATRRAA